MTGVALSGEEVTTALAALLCPEREPQGRNTKVRC